MIIKPKCEVGDLVSLTNNKRIWRVIAFHASAYIKDRVSIIYDLQDEDGRRTIAPESKVQEILV